jgi:hypothetical protein
VTTDVAVGQMRQIEFVADEEGDWALHCHKSHHTMNAMSHSVPTMIGVDTGDLEQRIRALVPGYMGMGASGMRDDRDADAAAGQHRAHDGGRRAVGAVGMGGMFSVLKVRRDQKRGDYSDPGWFQHPAGTLAHEVEGLPEAAPPQAPMHRHHGAMPGGMASEVQVDVRKPGPAARRARRSPRALKGVLKPGGLIARPARRPQAIWLMVLRKRSSAQANSAPPIARIARNCGHTTSRPAPR